MFETTRYRRSCFSGYGEDRVLESLVQQLSIDRGFYVDVGAYHPFKESNTALLYARGWSGINIDPSQESIDLFLRHRKRDISLPMAVSKTAGDVTYYAFGGRKRRRINTTSRARAHSIGKGYVEYVVPSLPLSAILNRHVPDGQSIDLLDVDCEFKDLEVLESLDWSTWRPKLLLVEDQEMDLDSSIDRFVLARDYRLISWCWLTKIYLDVRVLVT